MKKRIGFLLTICMTAALIACGDIGDIKSGDSGKMAASGYSATTASVSGGSSDTGRDTLKKEQIKYRFNDYEPVCYKDVVWTAMSEKMSEKEYSEFSEYLPALTGEIPVHWQAETGDEDDVFQDETGGFRGSDKTVRQVFEMLQGEVRSVLLCDMTKDGVKDLVIEGISSHPHMIIHKEGNEFYGDVYAHRQFRSPQKSGYFWWGKGSGHWYYLTFKDKKFEMTAEAGIKAKTKENGMDMEETYYIRDEKTDKKTYQRWEKKNLTGEIKKYEVPWRKA